MQTLREKDKYSAGFTLIEVMVTMVIALVILGGLMMNFVSQSSKYKEQDKRVDSTQDLEFAIRYIASDLQAALIKTTSSELKKGSVASVLFAAASDPYSTGYLSFEVWDTIYGGTNSRARRCYRYKTTGTADTLWQVYYDRHNTTCSASAALGDPIIGEKVLNNKGMRVTHFRIFLDDPSDISDREGFSNIPPPLPTKDVRDINNELFNMPGFTILLEVEVDAASRGSPVDVLDQSIANGKKRIWRYMQVYPAVLVSQ